MGRAKNKMAHRSSTSGSETSLGVWSGAITEDWGSFDHVFFNGDLNYRIDLELDPELSSEVAGMDKHQKHDLVLALIKNEEYTKVHITQESLL